MCIEGSRNSGREGLIHINITENINLNAELGNVYPQLSISSNCTLYLDNY